MSTEAKAKKRTIQQPLNGHTEGRRVVPEILACRPGELEPLIQHWMDRYPDLTTAFLLKRGLRLALRDIAGKRFAHLVDA